MKSWLLLFFSFTFYAYGQQKSAIDFYNEGINEKGNAKRQFEYFLKAARLAENNSELQLKAAYKVAYLYNYADEDQKHEVIKWSLTGLAIVKKTKRKDTLAANMFFRGARAYELDYKPDSALQSYQESIKRYAVFFGERSGEVADSYFLIGDVYSRILRDYNSAEKYYEKALSIREQLKNDELNVFMMSMFYSSLSKANLYQRDFDKALAYGLRNLAFAESINYPYYLELAYGHLADVYREIGQFPKSIELYSKAIALNKKNNDGRNNRNLSIYYFDLAQTYQQSGLVDEAIKTYRTGIAIFASLTNVKETSYIRGLYHLGELYLDRNPKEAKRMFDKSLNVVNEYGLDKTGYASHVYKSIGDYFLRTHQTDSSLHYYQNALKAASIGFVSTSFKDNPEMSTIVLKDFAYTALIQKAKVLRSIYVETTDRAYANYALRSYALAEELLTLSRGELDTDESKWNFFDSNFGLYEQVISLQFDLEQKAHSDTLINKAFYYMEGSKAKMLADALTESEFVRPLMSGDTLMQYLGVQKRNLYNLQSEFKKSTNSISQNEKEAERIRNAIIDTDRRIQTITNSIEKQYPSYIKTKYNRHVPKLNELKEYSEKHESAIIEFFWGSSEVFALLISNGQVTFKRLNPTESINANIDSLLTFLKEDVHLYDQKTINTFAANSTYLYKSLLGPFDSQIKDIKKIVIIPDGPIGQLPLEILIKPSTEKKIRFSDFNYFLLTHTVSYTFSSSYLLNQNRQELTDPMLLAYGFTGGSSQRSSSDTIRNNEIAGSKAELDLLATKFPNGKFHFGEDVTELDFKENAPNYDFLHLAVHGFGNTDQNYSSSLLFRDRANSNEDGLLHWYELFGMNLKAQLVVISSCESGIGKTYRGEGMLSMASAFSYAGCRNIVMGLWKVDDRVSVQLMDEFYKRIAEGLPVDEALALAKRSYLENGDELTANPRMWSSLVAYGNNQVMKKSIALPYIYIIFTFALLEALLFFMNVEISKGNQ